MVLFITSAERGSPLERIKAILLATLLEIGALDTVTAPMIVSGLLAPETQHREPELGDQLAERFLSWGRHQFVATVRSVLVDRDSVLDSLSQVAAPTLIVSGSRDHTLPSVHGQRMVQGLTDARHIEIHGAAHLVALEEPQEANSLLLDFLRDLPGT